VTKKFAKKHLSLAKVNQLGFNFEGQDIKVKGCKPVLSLHKLQIQSRNIY